MADHIEEESLDNPIDHPSENPPADIISTTDPAPVQQNQAIENMEVHHHPDLHHEPKKWKEYFLEFLMIFLAVTMGFFAETIRENIKEQRQAKEYATTMVSDLEADTSDLNSYLKYTSYASANIDTMMQLIAENDLTKIASGKLYWYGLWGGAHRTFVPHDATMHQMESSGSLRYFTNKFLNREVAQYDQLCRNWQKVEETDNGLYVEVRKARSKIFDSKYNNLANQIWLAKNTFMMQPRIDSFVKTNPPLLSYDKTLFNDYVELVRSRYIWLKVNNADSLRAHAALLIKGLKKEYNLENE
ncbi:MAG: hypothetical protein JST58_09510 [Bacteroidetes bacterium]|nr:hypothetical protein [Bacteroidota bacterium]